MDTDLKAYLDSCLGDMRRRIDNLDHVCANMANNLNLHIAEEDRLKYNTTWLLLRMGYIMEDPEAKLPKERLLKDLERLDALRELMVARINKLSEEGKKEDGNES